MDRPVRTKEKSVVISFRPGSKVRCLHYHYVVCQSAGVINCVRLAHIIVFNSNNYIHTRQVDMFATYVLLQNNEEDVPSEVWWLGRL